MKIVSRKLKTIPNHHIRKVLEECCPPGFDGELVLPDQSFQKTASAVMSRNGQPKFVYQVFDWVIDGHTDTPYHERMDHLARHMMYCDLNYIEAVLPVVMENEDELLDYETKCLEEGYEGVMVRTPNSPYKCGRSTTREQWLLKIKRFLESDAIIVDVEEKMHNANPAEVSELGLTKRSSHKENQEPMDTLGSLVVRDIKTGVLFKIGTGFDDEMRDRLWRIRNSLSNKIVKYKFQPVGVLDKPRFPVFLGMRSTLEEE